MGIRGRRCPPLLLTTYFLIPLADRNLVFLKSIPRPLATRCAWRPFDALSGSDTDWNKFRANGCISGYMHQRVWPYQTKHLLSEPQKLFSIDLEKIDPDDVRHQVRYSRTGARAGRLDLFGIYFRAHFDNEISFDTSPRSPRTHFENVCVRLEGLEVRPGDVIDVEWNLWRYRRHRYVEREVPCHVRAGGQSGARDRHRIISNRANNN